MEQKSTSGSNRLARLLAADVAAGELSAALISPIITIMDRAIVAQASTSQTLVCTLKSFGFGALMSPKSFVTSKHSKITFILYATTYIVANAADTLCQQLLGNDGRAPIVFLSTFIVNVPLGVWKDVRFSQFDATKGRSNEALAAVTEVKNVKNTVAASTRAPILAFLFRDALTIFGSFTLPGWVAPMVPTDLLPDRASREALTQIMVPVLSQVAATPIHLLGLDLFARQDGATLRERMGRVRQFVPSTTTARCFRIIPAFGFGVIANQSLRQRFQIA